MSEKSRLSGRLQVSSHTKEAYLEAFWAWVRLMGADNFDSAASAIDWGARPESLRERVETFFDDGPWTVVVPNDRLVNKIESLAEVDLEPQRADGQGWFMAHIPVTRDPDRALEDDVELMGIAVSFFVVEEDHRLLLSFEIFHI